MNKFGIATELYFGEGALKKLLELDNKNILIVCDKFINSSGLVAKIKENIKNCNVEIFDGIIPDPTVEVVATGVQILKKRSFDIIIAVGGGSSIDGAKAIKEYYNLLNKENSQKMEFYAIPTTSGTGSEVTEYSVITNEKEGIKYALTSKELLPDVAILDAELVKTVPQSITADTGMDVLTHAIEAYVSLNSNDFTDAFAEKAFSLVIENLEKVYLDGTNLQKRERLHNASCLAGLAFNSAGLGITHSLAHAIGGKFHLPHGKLNAIILPYVIEYNSDCAERTYTDEPSETSRKYQKLAKLASLNANNPVIAVKNLVNHIYKMNALFKIPKNLKSLIKNDLDRNSLKEEIFSAIEKDICTATNPRKPLKKDIFHLVDKILG